MSVAIPTSPGVTLTDQQGRALRVPDASVALSAGAGCGKTMVLTERFLAALDDGGGRPLQALVALTFTEKAARELRQRIRARCRAKLAAGDDPGWWWTVLRGLDAAPIGTFHEFCARLLRRHAMQVGVDPEFAILDESIAGSLREEAVRIALRKLLAARDADLIDLGTDYGLRQVREALGRLASMRGAVGLEEWAQQDPEAIVEHWRAMRRGQALADGPRPRIGPWPSHCRRLLEGSTRTCRRSATAALALLDALRLLDPGAAPLPRRPPRRAGGAAAGRRPAPQAASWPSEEIYEAIKDAIRRPARAYQETRQPGAGVGRRGFPAGDGRPEPAVRPAGAGGPSRARAAQATSPRARLRRPAGHGPRPAARPPRAGRPAESPDARLARPIEFVLVDEFQDTDAIQGEILRLLSGAAFLTGPAVRRRRREAVDLPVPRRRAVDLPRLAVRVPRAGPAQPDRELPQRARRHRLRQRPVRRLLPRAGPVGPGRSRRRRRPSAPCRSASRTPASRRSSSSGRRRRRRARTRRASRRRRSGRRTSGG